VRRLIDSIIWLVTLVVCGIGLLRHFGTVEQTPYYVCAWVCLEHLERLIGLSETGETPPLKKNEERAA
jgi:hypothetical protein